jgi:DNA-binding NarL/FixJ family response regulator
MDIQLPGMSGIECTAALKLKLPALRVMMLTVYEDSDAIFDALKAGTSGYLLKRSAPDRLIAAIKELHHGGSPMTSEIARKVIDSFHSAKTATHPEDRLTPREEEVLQFLAKGYSPRKSGRRWTFPMKPSASISSASMRNSTSTPAPRPY